MIVQFPDVNVDIKTHGSKQHDYVRNLGLDASNPAVSSLAYALAWGIEGNRDFFGATIDGYAEAVRHGAGMSEQVRKVSNLEALRHVSQQFAERDLVYGVVLAQDEQVAWTEDKGPEDSLVIYKGMGSLLMRDPQPILRREQINSFLLRQDDYDWKRVARTIFIPSTHFTQEVWGFSYGPENLGTIVRYAVDPQKPEPKKESKVSAVVFSKPGEPDGPRRA